MRITPVGGSIGPTKSVMLYRTVSSWRKPAPYSLPHVRRRVEKRRSSRYDKWFRLYNKRNHTQLIAILTPDSPACRWPTSDEIRTILLGPPSMQVSGGVGPLEFTGS